MNKEQGRVVSQRNQRSTLRIPTHLINLCFQSITYRQRTATCIFWFLSLSPFPLGAIFIYLWFVLRRNGHKIQQNINTASTRFESKQASKLVTFSPSQSQQGIRFIRFHGNQSEMSTQIAQLYFRFLIDLTRLLLPGWIGRFRGNLCKITTPWCYDSVGFREDSSLW